jgi:hypothetical protein
MSEKATTWAAMIADEFLKHYLKNGMGAMSKGDVDAIVMHLLDKYSHQGGVQDEYSRFRVLAWET